MARARPIPEDSWLLLIAIDGGWAWDDPKIPALQVLGYDDEASARAALEKFRKMHPDKSAGVRAASEHPALLRDLTR